MDCRRKCEDILCRDVGTTTRLEFSIEWKTKSSVSASDFHFSSGLTNIVKCNIYSGPSVETRSWTHVVSQ